MILILILILNLILFGWVSFGQAQDPMCPISVTVRVAETELGELYVSYRRIYEIHQNIVSFEEEREGWALAFLTPRYYRLGRAIKDLTEQLSEEIESWNDTVSGISGLPLLSLPLTHEELYRAEQLAEQAQNEEDYSYRFETQYIPCHEMNIFLDFPTG